MKSTVQIRIDGKTVEAPAGSTILDVAKSEGIHIPVLCYSPLLRPLENCRLCVVAVAGENQYKAACSTVVTEDMDITTNSDELFQTRKLLLELLLDTHYGDCVAPCTATCPANVDIQGYLGYIRKGEYEEAVKCIKKNIPMPLTIGRVCPHPCESACRRHLVEEAVNINHCKRFVADYEMGKGNKVLPQVPAESGKRVAIIGGGPAGLSLAFYLRSMGHGCTIFDSKDKLGGMLRYGIPEYRLPKATLDWEIDGILSLGVEVKYEQRWGRDFKLEDLKNQGFDAIFLGIGAWASNKLGVEGEGLDGVWGGIDFLDLVASGKPPKLGKHVVIIGGGNTAIDAARTALRLGVPKVTILYRRTKKEMPANPEEIHAAEHEKVDIQILAAPTRLIGEDGKLKAIEFLRMELGEPDASGRRRPVPVPGSETTMDVDQVINAIGQGPKLPSSEEDAAMSSLPVTRWNTFGGDEGSQHTGQEMVFSGGDVFRGPMTVVAALADGRKAAYAMDAYFRTGQIQSEPVLFNVSKGTLKTIDPEPFSVFKQAPRNRMPEIPVEQAVSSFDAVELGLTEEATRNEADRCLVCGCSAGFDCRLRDALTEFKVKWRDQTEKKIHFKTMQAVDSNVEIVLDPNKCIRCQRCHIACMTFQCSDAIDLKEYPTFIDGKCVHCGLCVDLCPTGALLVKRDGRAVDRFDWKSVASHCVNCGIGCALDLKVSGQRLVWIKDGKQEAPNHSSTCRRGRFRIYDDLWYGQRINQPMIKQDGSWQEVSWDQAVDAVVQGFKRTADTAGAGAIAAVGSPQASNESLYLLQKWLRVGYSSHGLDFLGRVAHERLLEKMEETIGFAGMTQELAGLDRAEAVFLVGDGIEELAPVVATLVRRAARQRQVPVFQIASREDGLTPLATGPVKAPAGAWHKALQGILAAAASSGAVAGEMLAKAGLKVDQLKNKLGATDLKAAASNSGVPAGTLEQMAAALSKNGKVAFVFPENLLETDDTAGCVTTLIQLAALTGNLGGANAGGLYPLTNEINVSGAQLMGISPNYLPGGVKITSATARKNIAKIWQATKMPAAPATALLAALDSQQIKALFVQQAARLGDAYLQRLGQVDFLVLQEAVTSPAMDMAQVVLPMAAFGEQEGTVVNMERRLLKLQQAFAPCGAALADWEGIARIMAAQGLPAPKDLNELHQEWNEVVAGMAGFPFNGKLAEGIQLPYNKDSGSGTCCFDASTVKKMKLGL